MKKIYRKTLKKISTMVNLSIHENCKICENKGEIIYSKNYTDTLFNDFFEKFYGNSNLKKLMNYVKKESFTLLICKDCKFIWQKIEPEGDFAFKIYENIIDKNASLEKSKKIEKSRKQRFQSEFNFISNYFGNKKINVLDYGAGWGSWINCLDNSKANLYAYELSPSRKKYLLKKDIKVIDEKNIYNYKEFFQFIRVEQVLEHLPNLKISLELINSLTCKDAIVQVSVPNGIYEIKNKNNIKISKGPIQPLEHVNCFSNKSLKKLFLNFEFYPVSIKKILYIYIRNFSFDLRKIKTLLKDIYDNFFSTSIMFKKNKFTK